MSPSARRSIRTGRILAALRHRRMLQRRRSTLLLDPRTADPAIERDRLEDIDCRMMERAIRLAQQAFREGEIPVAAIVYRGTEVLAEAHNRREFHPDPTGHAEILALREAGRRLGAWRLLGCSIAVTLEPCAMCAGAMVNARVARLIYGARDPKAGACESLYAIATDPRLNHRLVVHSGVYAQRCARLLSDFFAARRRAGPRR